MPDSRFFQTSGPLALGELAVLAGATLADPLAADAMIDAITPLARATPTSATFFSDRRYTSDLKASQARACFVPVAHVDALPAGCTALIAANPHAAFALAADRFYAPRLHSSADPVIHPDLVVEDDVFISHGVVIGPGVKIGAGTVIGANTVIGPGVSIGRGCQIGSNVRDRLRLAWRPYPSAGRCGDRRGWLRRHGRSDRGDRRAAARQGDPAGRGDDRRERLHRPGRLGRYGGGGKHQDR